MSTITLSKNVAASIILSAEMSASVLPNQFIQTDCESDFIWLLNFLTRYGLSVTTVDRGEIELNAVIPSVEVIIDADYRGKVFVTIVKPTAEYFILARPRGLFEGYDYITTAANVNEVIEEVSTLLKDYFTGQIDECDMQYFLMNLKPEIETLETLMRIDC